MIFKNGNLVPEEPGDTTDRTRYFASTASAAGMRIDLGHLLCDAFTRACGPDLQRFKLSSRTKNKNGIIREMKTCAVDFFDKGGEGRGSSRECEG